MTPRRLALVVLILSLGVIGGALVFQYGVKLVPCELCLKERWPWYAAMALAALALLAGPRGAVRIVPAVFGLLFLASAALAFYHVGVEQGLFAGPDACSAPPIKPGTSVEDLTRQLLATPPVLCGEVQWSLFGISLAGFNLAVSLLAAGLSLWSWRRARS